MLLKNCRFVITQNPVREILENTDIRIEKDCIAGIGNFPDAEETINCTNAIVLPGLVNTHTHIAMQGLRGICDDSELHDWLEQVITAEKKFSDEDIARNASLACREMLRFGTTTFCDMYWPMEQVMNAVSAIPIRAVLCPTLFSAHCTGEKCLKEAARFVEENAGRFPNISFGLGVHSVYGCTEETLRAVKAYATQHRLLTPIHVAETRRERYDCLYQRGALPVEYLQRIGFLDEKTLLVHAIWLTKGEVQRMGKAGAKVSHCPVSNMKLASGGVMPLMEMQAAGVCVGLGTDSVVSNNNLDIFEEMKVTGLLHKFHRWDATVAGVQEILDMATINGARCLGMEKETGSIETGKKADVIIIPVAPHLQPCTKENVLSALVYAARGHDIRNVLVDGRMAVQEGKVI